MERLTDERFWDDYWAGVEVPTSIDASLPFERALAAFLDEVLPEGPGAVLEIGCAPGKWLAFAAQAKGLVPSGIEYSTPGLAATVRNFDAHGIVPDMLLEGDFFEIEPEPRFDVVMSFGFIEHFDEPCAVVERHVRWLRPGGVLVLGVPNFRGVHGFLQRHLGPVTYAAHNIEVMDRDWLTGCGAALGLTTERVDWMAGFEPTLPIIERDPRSAVGFTARIGLGLARRVRRSRALDGVGGPAFSAYLGWAARKQDEPQ